MNNKPIYLTHAGYGRIHPNGLPIYMTARTVAALHGLGPEQYHAFVRGVAYPENYVHLWPSAAGVYVRVKASDR